MENFNKPKLILLNGPLGVGKSSLASLYSERHPLALKLDIDLIRMNFGQWRDNKEESARLAWDVAIEMGRVALSSDRDVVVAQMVRFDKQVEKLEALAQDTNSEFFEILLCAEEDEAIERFIARGEAAGFEKGYTPNGLIARAGGIKRVREMYHEMMEFAESRTETIRVSSTSGKIEDTYTQIIAVVDGSNSSEV